MRNAFRAFFVTPAFALLVTACATATDPRPLGPDLRQWAEQSATTPCSNLQPRYRIAAGVRAAIDMPQYRDAVLREMAGSRTRAMPYAEAATLSSRSAATLRAEIARRCPEQRIDAREDIVYVPQRLN